MKALLSEEACCAPLAKTHWLRNLAPRPYWQVKPVSAEAETLSSYTRVNVFSSSSFGLVHGNESHANFWLHHEADHVIPSLFCGVNLFDL